MSKKTNSILFILGATLINIVITLICMFILLAVYARVIVPLVPAESAGWGIPIIFISAVIISFLVYRVGVKLFMKKVDVEKNFDPLFSRKKQPVKRDGE